MGGGLKKLSTEPKWMVSTKGLDRVQEALCYHRQ